MTTEKAIDCMYVLKELRVFGAPELLESVDVAISAIKLKQQLDELGLTIEEIKGMKEISIKGENHPCIDCKFNQPHLLGCPYLCKELNVSKDELKNTRRRKNEDR